MAWLLIALTLWLGVCGPVQAGFNRPHLSNNRTTRQTAQDLAKQDWSRVYTYWKANYVTFVDATHAYVYNTDLSWVITEGQSYGMLMALWNDDKPTFDAIWNWTDENMRRTGQTIPNSRFGTNVIATDKLFGWRAGTNGVLSSKYIASDGDLQIGRALLEAYKKWGDTGYLTRGVEIAQDLWTQCTVSAHGKRIFMPGDQASYYDDFYAWNPGYFSPVAFRLFAEYDTGHDWAGLIADNYEILTDTSNALSTVGMPPDWAGIDLPSYAIVPYTDPDKSDPSDFRNEAVRVFWHIADDWLVYGSPEAKTYLNNSLFLQTQLASANVLTGYYTDTGAALNGTPSEYAYGALVAQSAVVSPAKTYEYYRTRLRPQFNSSGYWGTETTSYYRTSVVSFLVHSLFVSHYR